MKKKHITIFLCSIFTITILAYGVTKDAKAAHYYNKQVSSIKDTMQPIVQNTLLVYGSTPIDSNGVAVRKVAEITASGKLIVYDSLETIKQLIKNCINYKKLN